MDGAEKLEEFGVSWKRLKSERKEQQSIVDELMKKKAQLHEEFTKVETDRVKTVAMYNNFCEKIKNVDVELCSFLSGTLLSFNADPMPLELNNVEPMLPSENATSDRKPFPYNVKLETELILDDTLPMCSNRPASPVNSPSSRLPKDTRSAAYIAKSAKREKAITSDADASLISDVQSSTSYSMVNGYSFSEIENADRPIDRYTSHSPSTTTYRAFDSNQLKFTSHSATSKDNNTNNKRRMTESPVPSTSGWTNGQKRSSTWVNSYDSD